jgi:ribosomal protein S18 acetylase RimI-like enzyme
MQAALRAALIEDHADVAHVLLESRKAFLPFAPLTHTYEETQDWVLKSPLRENQVTVAVAHGKVVAMLATSTAENIDWIEQLYVLPGYDGKGLGSQLLSHALSYLKHPIRLYTFQQNSGARRFYEHHGFKAVAFSDGQSNAEKCPDVLYESTAHGA